jgi:BirA family biotin operon repressor/biotin-[acetyl-CoA-carboxylase] ligase
VSISFVKVIHDRLYHRHFSEIPSTQDAVDSYEACCSSDQWVLVTTDYQTAGRGTHGRSWVSPPGKNILMTLMLPSLPPEKLRYLTVVVGLTLVQLLQAYDLDAKLKWVNDILIQGEKIAGILCHSDAKFCKIGIGFNINSGQEDFPLMDKRATSMKSLITEESSRETVLNELVNRLIANIDRLKTHSFQSEFLPSIENALAYQGQEVTLVFGLAGKESQPIIGRLDGINSEGHIIISGNAYSSGSLTI